VGSSIDGGGETEYRQTGKTRMIRCSRKLCERRRLVFIVCVGSERLRVTPCDVRFHFTSIVHRSTPIGLLSGATDLRAISLSPFPGCQCMVSPQHTVKIATATTRAEVILE
jgi:hypothetical protein